MNHVAIALGIGLALSAIQDIKNKKIIVWPMTAAFAGGLTRCLISGQPEIAAALSGAGIGGILCLISQLSKKEIGMGDGMVAAVIGIYMGIKFTLICIALAFFLIFPAALSAYCFRKSGGKYSMPFIPFVFLGYLLTLCINGG
jgi:leader peptidase (prepilin peptidase)/N-methyltransferase